MWAVILYVLITGAPAPVIDATSMLEQGLADSKASCEKFVTDFKVSRPDLFDGKNPNIAKSGVLCVKL